MKIEIILLHSVKLQSWFRVFFLPENVPHIPLALGGITAYALDHIIYCFLITTVLHVQSPAEILEFCFLFFF